MSAPVPSPVLVQARALHRRHPVVECHTDIPIDVYRRRRAGQRAPYRDDYLGRLLAGGVRVQMLAVGGDVPRQHENAGTPEASARAMIGDARDERLRVVQTVGELDEVAAGGEPGFVLHLEGCRPIETAGAAAFHALGVRSLQLTWNGANAFADGVGVDPPRGLTPRGRELVAELRDLDILIDVAHLAEPGFWDLHKIVSAQTVCAPIICSHANAAAVQPHPRNLSDDQIRAIAGTGGFVGVCFVGSFIGEEPSLERVLDHVDHMVGLAGVESVAVGPDYVAFAADLMIEPGEEALYLGPEGLRDVETLPVFTAGLLARGYSEADAARILGGNALRVLRQTLPGG